MNTFKAVLFIMCAIAGCSQAQYMQSGNPEWQNQGAPTGPIGGGVSPTGPAAYGSSNRDAFLNEWIPITESNSGMTRGSYGTAQQIVVAPPAIQPMSLPSVAPAPVQEEASMPAAEVPASTIFTASMESCAAPTATAASTTVYQICTCTRLPSTAEDSASGFASSNVATAEEFPNQTAEQHTSADTEMSSFQQSAPVAQQGNRYSLEHSTSSQSQTSFNSGKNY